MSFILDALKKLEQKRQQSAVPDLLTLHAPDPVKREKHSIWLYLILSALFVNALVLTVWLRPWNSEKQGAAKEPSIVKPSNKDAGISPSVSAPFIKEEETHIPIQKLKEGIKQSSHVSGKTAAKQASEPALNASRKEPTGKIVQKTETSAVKEVPDAVSKSSPETPPVHDKPEEVTENIQAASSEKIPVLNELPLSIRQEIPEISISVHIYSDSPPERMVNINGSIRREGDMVASGIKLIEITESGVILSYKDSNFFVKGF